VFRRRSAAAPETPDETLARLNAEAETDAAHPGKKAGPTLTRKEAERLRKERLTPPKDRRQRMREDRAKVKAARQKSRQALLSGDQKNLPARDAGPVRAFARDFVDARRTAAEFFLPGALVVLLLSIPRNLTVQTISMFLWLGMILLIVLDSTLVARRLSREVRRRFPDEPRRGLVPYALMRSMQIRRLRLPPPRVKPGTKTI
jgi:hypothetical protein